ncbi:RHS repeat domain-containing protein [Agarilytica rhodophyticola]|uniref:RHS repeat domain-containing protein n=1 Tax=Agarilytica rhodophyticola TaxID=1737490 RepID=UPI000B348A88|nr:RHS repeat-associated core domain-containing protein [Agarilytica rhodophyticola]
MEKLTHPDGTQSIKRYLPGGALVTIKLDSAGSRVNQETQYLHKDHLGSLDVITNAMGTIAQDESGRDLVFSFDAWGQKRAALDWSTLMDNALSDFNTLVVTSPITRGFTMHEHLDAVGLIHMNGRIYDPRLGRFMQADPFVQAASNTQSYNRYSYVFNNPLNATDPSGYFSVGGFLGAVQTIVTAIAAIYCQACIPYISAAFGAVHAARAGGDLGDIARAAVSSYASASITSSYLADGFSWEGLLQVAVAGGITNVLNNGKFGHGFISAGVGTALGGKLAPVANETTNNILKGLGSIVLSGTISKATGGKFANGAGSAAFAWAVRAGISSRQSVLQDSGHGNTPIGECASKGKCHFNDFTPEERAAIQKKIDTLSVDLQNKPFNSTEDAAIALHESGLVEYGSELGIELWAKIDDQNNIYEVSTGFDHSAAIGATETLPYKHSAWHTHPSGNWVHAGDLEAIINRGGAAVFASGRELSRMRNPNFDPATRIGSGSLKDFSRYRRSVGKFKFEVYNDGLWDTYETRGH